VHTHTDTDTDTDKDTDTDNDTDTDKDTDTRCYYTLCSLSLSRARARAPPPSHRACASGTLVQGRRRHLNVTVFSRNYSPHARIYEGEGAKEAGTIIVSQRVQMCVGHQRV